MIRPLVSEPEKGATAFHTLRESRKGSARARINRTFKFAALLAAISLLAGQPAKADVAVTIHVRTADGKPGKDAYVALVPLWRPSSRPLVEEISKTGISILDVPAGFYQLVVGAPGFAVSSRGPVEIEQSSGMNLDMALAALQPVNGTVTDGDGHPLAGARVASAQAAIPAPLGSLSVLAVKHLAPDWTTTTDELGHWSLKLPPGGAVPLLFEAPGRAAAWRIRSENDTADFQVALLRGAVLKVAVDRLDPNLVVTLKREDGEATNHIVATDRSRVWARWATSKVLDWSSLSPGQYAVYAKYSEPRFFMQTAVKIGTVTLAPGDERTLRAVLPPERHGATHMNALFLRGISRSSKDLDHELEGFGRAPAGNPQHVETFLEEVIAGTVVYGKTDGVNPLFYVRTAGQFFTTIPDLAADLPNPYAEPWLASVHTRADAYLQLRYLEKEVQLVHSGVAVLSGCGKVDRVTVSIGISKFNVASFTAPAGCRSMVLHLDPFEPVISDRVLLPGDQSLGEVVLRSAGSADVHVVRDPGGVPVEKATVKVISAERPGETSTVVKEAMTDEGGWAHVSGLPPYWKLLVLAEAPEGDRSETAVLRVRPREQSVIDPLAVPTPATLIVEAKVDPAFLARFPAARLGTLFVRPADPDRQSEEKQALSLVAEPTRFDRLRPGRWFLTGVVHVAGTSAPFELEELSLKAGEEKHVETTISPNVFEGVVTSNGKGVAARVIVEDRDRKVYFDSAENGEFRATLEERGSYPVGVARLRAQGNVIPIGNVAFTDPSRRIDISIPTGASVIVRLRRGDSPVPNTVVWLSRRNTSGLVEETTNRGQTTNAQGEATFDDLIAGPWTFTVRRTDTGGGAEKTVVVESGKNLTIDLELSKNAAIEGVVRDLGGLALPRAIIECLFAGPTGNPDLETTAADEEGRFAIELIPPPPPLALCSMIGPLGEVDGFKAIPDQPVQITVPGATATLRISDWPAVKRPELMWLVAPDGRAVSLNTVAKRFGRFDAPLTIPALAAGAWKIIRVDFMPQWAVLANGLGFSFPALAEITLRPGTTKTVSLTDLQ
jgi:hypothetical protein